MSGNNYNNRNNNWSNNQKKSWGGNKKPWFKKNWSNNKNNKNNPQNQNPNNQIENNQNQNNGHPNNFRNNTNRKNFGANFQKNYHNSQKLYNDNNLVNNDEDDDFENENSSGLIFDPSVKDTDNLVNTVEENTGCPFSTWNLYFPKEKFKENSDTHKAVEKFQKFIDSCSNKFDINKIIENSFVNLDFKDLCSDQGFCFIFHIIIKPNNIKYLFYEVLNDILPEFSIDFVEKPQFYLNCIGLAMHQFILDKFNSIIEKIKIKKSRNVTNESAELNMSGSVLVLDDIGNLPSFIAHKSIPQIKIRILNYRQLTKIKQLKANMYDKFVSVMGTVVRVSNPKPFVTRLAFQCKNCNSTFQITLTEGKYMYPTRCASKTCRSRTFIPLKKHFMTKVVEWQRIK